MRIIFSDDFMVQMRVGSNTRLKITVMMMMAQPQLLIPGPIMLCSACKARYSGLAMMPHQPTESAMQAIRQSGLPSAPMAWMELRMLVSFGPA